AVLHPSPSPRLSRRFLHSLHVSKLLARRPLGLSFIHSALHALSRRHLQMAPHFCVKVRFPLLVSPKTHRLPLFRDASFLKDPSRHSPPATSFFTPNARPPSDRRASPALREYSLQ